LEEIGFRQCYSDQDHVWRRAPVKKDGTKYYEYILVYVDDQLTMISEDPKAIIDALQTPPFSYDLKDVAWTSYKVISWSHYYWRI